MALNEKQWSALRAEYIAGDISMEKLSQKYNVSVSTLKKHACEDKWVNKRNEYRSKLELKFVENSTDIEAAERALKLVSLQKSADSMASVIEKVLTDNQQFYRHIISESIGGGATETDERIYSKVDTRAIKDLTAAMKDLTTIMRNLYDIPTLAEKKAQDIAGERLQLDRKKAEMDDNRTDTIVVKFEDAEDLSE